ncbi:MAG: hypothetical protein ABIO72_02070 [Patescibacteria group bacterium]
MNRFEYASLVLQILTLFLASYFAYTQNVINDRQARITDYVSITAVPDNGGIRLLNTGATNVYINAITVDGERTEYKPARQIAARAIDAASYFVPITLETANKDAFSVRVEIEDEFGTHWISTQGGAKGDDDPATGRFSIWTERTTKQ